MDRVPTESSAAPPGVIVAGMHRSATSLTTAVLAGCGWQTTGELMGASPSNPRGHFEDWDIHRLHESVLADRGLEWDSVAGLRHYARHPLGFDGHESEVAELVSRLRRAGRPWVWKNPRATLLLDAWAQALPEACVVLCVRSPAAVVDSLLRRQDRLKVPVNGRLRRMRRLLRALSLWRSYNRAALRFARQHRERVVVIRVPDDLTALAVATRPSRFERQLLADRPRTKIQLLVAFALRSQLLHLRLRRLYDPAQLVGVLSGPAPTPARVGGNPDSVSV